MTHKRAKKKKKAWSAVKRQGSYLIAQRAGSEEEEMASLLHGKEQKGKKKSWSAL